MTWLVVPEELPRPVTSQPTTIDDDVNMTLPVLTLPLRPQQRDAELWVWACLLSIGVVAVFPRVGACTKIFVMTLITTAHINALMFYKDHELSIYDWDDNFLLVYFSRYYHRLPGVAWWVVVGVQVLALVGVLGVLGGQSEARARTHYTWASRVAVEQEEVETTRGINKILLENILPAYLAHRYLVSSNVPQQQELYHERYSSVGVMFASIPNYKEFYDETDVNKQGLECLRLLNEIICDYDKLLLKPKYSLVEKIKTIGSTYMVASGLHPGKEEFALALAAVLDAINKESFQSFKLRVGLAHGPVIAGVVGAQKPQYDIWGNTVNVASRMDSTGLMGRIQVTEETAAILQGAGWECECRGPTPIKGKGTLITYFVSTPYDPPVSELRSTLSSYALRPDEGALLRHAAPISSGNSLLVRRCSQSPSEPEFTCGLPSSSDDAHGDSSCSSLTTIRVPTGTRNSQDLTDTTLKGDPVVPDDATILKKVVVCVKDGVTSSRVIHGYNDGDLPFSMSVTNPGGGGVGGDQVITQKKLSFRSQQRIQRVSPDDKKSPVVKSNPCATEGGCEGEGVEDILSATHNGGPSTPTQQPPHSQLTTNTTAGGNDNETLSSSSEKLATPVKTKAKVSKQMTLDYSVPRDTRRMERLSNQAMSFDSTHLPSTSYVTRGGGGGETGRGGDVCLEEGKAINSRTGGNDHTENHNTTKHTRQQLTEHQQEPEDKTKLKDDHPNPPKPDTNQDEPLDNTTKEPNSLATIENDAIRDSVNRLDKELEEKLLEKCNEYENPVDSLQKRKIPNMVSKGDILASQNGHYEQKRRENFEDIGHYVSRNNKSSLREKNSSFLPKIRRGKSIDVTTPSGKINTIDAGRRVSMVNYVNEKESTPSTSGCSEKVPATCDEGKVVVPNVEGKVAASFSKKSVSFTTSGLVRKKSQVFV
ncbi:Adenylate cyclase type 2-like 2 [Homarus americanus]|uniref:adenylate cyclase n=1 Tax=Homarus americanus TaxID=6706 RepID=A0A8J5K0N1_HOMAM|nr:Adenylate cyclase type 2-like 2 [Homarus americanus]